MGHHHIVKLISVALALHATSTNIVQSQEHVSSVRRAAIDKLQNKLGTMRGSIKPKEKRVYLTPIMIEQLKPITSKSHIVAKQLVDEKSAETVKTEYQYILPDFAIGPVDGDNSANPATSQINQKRATKLASEAIEISNENISTPVAVFELNRTIKPRVIEISQQHDASPAPVQPKIRISERSERLRREIFNAIRVKQAKPSKNRLVTNSVSAPKEIGNETAGVKDKRSSLPNTTNVEVLLKAVDEMIAKGG